ncbi:MAG TPA: hypothetical protein VJJ98_03350, partial [Sedimentisphaerales bacterium]|nr:hypothetical protein [Sedimentisphaerales bacterium]
QAVIIAPTDPLPHKGQAHGRRHVRPVEASQMKWRPHAKFAMPGVVALLLAVLFGTFIPQ